MVDLVVSKGGEAKAEPRGFYQFSWNAVKRAVFDPTGPKLHP
jgi:hypothetical protein